MFPNARLASASIPSLTIAPVSNAAATSLAPTATWTAVWTAVLGLSLFACASFPGNGDGSPPIAIEYRLASFSRGSFPLNLQGFEVADCVSGEATESLEYIYPSGRRVSVAVSTAPGFALDVRQGQVALHEMPLEDGLQVAARAELTIDNRRMKKARKFKNKHRRCELVVLVDGVLADLLVGATPWDQGLPAGRFATLDRAREIFERPSLSITVVPEPFEVTRWRHDYRRWQAHQTRWRFRCDSSFRANMKRNYPETHARLVAEDRFFVGQPCSERPRPPHHPGR